MVKSVMVLAAAFVSIQVAVATNEGSGISKAEYKLQQYLF